MPGAGMPRTNGLSQDCEVRRVPTLTEGPCVPRRLLKWSPPPFSALSLAHPPPPLCSVRCPSRLYIAMRLPEPCPPSLGPSYNLLISDTNPFSPASDLANSCLISANELHRPMSTVNFVTAASVVISSAGMTPIASRCPPKA